MRGFKTQIILKVIFRREMKMVEQNVHLQYISILRLKQLLMIWILMIALTLY